MDDQPLALVVEDDADLAQLAEIVLADAGFRVVTAGNGARALAKLDVVTPDVIVTDMMMPELDGLAFLQRYSRRSPPRAPVLAVSGFAPYLEQARRLGAERTMRKPYDLRAMALAARELADAHRARAGQRATGEVPAPGPEPLADGPEEARLRAVLELALEEPDSELGLQQFLDEVAEIFSVPVAGIHVITREQQRVIAQCSRASFDADGPRADSFCTHAVAARAALVVQDACENPFFRENPIVKERGLRFYAGVPLTAVHGEAIGTLCVLDTRPHHFTHFDLELLALLSRRVMSAIELRERQRSPAVPESVFRYLHCVDRELGVYGKALFTDLLAVEASRAAWKRQPAALVVAAVAPERLASTVEGLREIARGGLVGRLGRARLGVILPGRRPAEARTAVAQCAGEGALVVAAALEEHVGATSTALLHAEQALGAAGL